MENKDAICKALAETLKLTRNHQDLDDLYYMVEANGGRDSKSSMDERSAP